MNTSDFPFKPNETKQSNINLWVTIATAGILTICILSMALNRRRFKLVRVMLFALLKFYFYN